MRIFALPLDLIMTLACALFGVHVQASPVQLKSSNIPSQECGSLLENFPGSLSLETVAVFDFLFRPPGRKAELALARLYKSLEAKKSKLIKLILEQSPHVEEAGRDMNSSSKESTLVRLERAFVAELLEWRTQTSATLSDPTKDPEIRRRALDNFRKANRFLLQQSTKSKILTLEFIDKVHQLHQRGRISQRARIQFRTNEVALGDYRGAMVAASDVSPAMNALVKWYANEIQKPFGKQMHPIELAARFYQIFISIHPFDDANGRTGRDLMDFILLSHGWPPAIFSGPSIKTSAISYYYLTHPQETARLMRPEDLTLVVSRAVDTALEKLFEAHQ